MGCDIHLFVEKKVDGKWVSADSWEREEEEGFNSLSVDYNKRFYSGRNYDLFAILADVRNGSGFAGCDTGDGFVPIDSPRGIPEDASTEVKECSERWDGDGHSHSWFTLAELLAYDWTQTTKLRGMVNGPGFAEWDRYERHQRRGPKGYCGGVGGKGISHVSSDELEARVKGIIKDLTDKNQSDKIEETLLKETGAIFARVEWELAYHSTCAEFWSDTIPKLLKLGKQDEVRIVFFFDN